MFSVNKRLAALEENVRDLTDSARMTCTTLDTIGDPSLDCCISGNHDLPYGDRDQFVCMGRTAATALGVTTGASCQVCPAGVIKG